MPQGIVGIVFKRHPRGRVPLGMLLAKALLGIGAQSQLLALSQLDDEDVCGERRESVKGQGGMVGPPKFWPGVPLEGHTHLENGSKASCQGDRQHERLRHTSASLLACKGAGWVATCTLTPAPYHPVPRSHWGHYLGSGMSPAGAQTETFVSCSSSQPLLWQLPSSTSNRYLPTRDGMPGNEGVEVPTGAQSVLVTVLQAPLHSCGTAFCQNSTMALSGVLG